MRVDPVSCTGSASKVEVAALHKLCMSAGVVDQLNTVLLSVWWKIVVFVVKQNR